MINTLPAAETKLTLDQVLFWLQVDGMISDADYEKCQQYSHNKKLHPLKIIVNCEACDQTQMGKPLTLEGLTQWLARKVSLPYYYIDPLKIDVAAVTLVCSQAYANNHTILPVQISDDEIVVAVAEPYIHAWEADLRKMQNNRHIKCVLANPDEIRRYLNEFYAFAKSLKGATTAQEQQSFQPMQNFEQLVELSKMSDVDANNQHIVNLVSWLLQYAFDQRASDIHIEPRRNLGNVRFRIDGILHTVYQLPAPIMMAVVSRL